MLFVCCNTPSMPLQKPMKVRQYTILVHHSSFFYSHVFFVHSPAIKSDVNVTLAIRLAALLHDVDDHKYFPRSTSGPDLFPESYHNARTIMTSLATAVDTIETQSFVTTMMAEIQELVITMIDLVSCSQHGNSVPSYIVEGGLYHYLIPRWSDRLEAVGIIGVIRCYQYNMAKNQPLYSLLSLRATNVEEVWRLATPEMLDAYISRGGTSSDMISHYYDKLLHIARPPKHLVQNNYLESQAETGVAPLVEVCVRFGQTGMVDEDYLRSLETQHVDERMS